MSIAVWQVREERRSDAPLFVHPDWAREFPWLVQGMTGREAGNFSMFGAQNEGAFHERWRELRKWTGARAAVLGRQVHGNRVLVHAEFAAGLLLADDSDGHMTAAPGVLLAVSVADCVPVFVVDAQKRTVAVLHAGWRGTAAGIVGRCIKMMGTNVLVHFGPAICGDCYEVGPEVHAALGRMRPEGISPVDLRAVLTAQCVAIGVRGDNITTSAWCTRCGISPFYSYRGGDPERQVAIVGVN